jgi:hypothetical protein
MDSGRLSMRTTTDKVGILQALEQELSDDATLQDAIDYLYYLYTIEQAIEESDSHPEKMVPHEEVVRRIEQWLK